MERGFQSHFIHSRRGSGGFEEFRVFVPEEGGSLAALVTFGSKLEGHAGVVHGGATATACDELFGWATQLCLPPAARGAAYFTANLSVDYRAPVMVNTTVLVRVHVESVEGRKLRMKARVERAHDGVLVAEANALFIRAKWYYQLLTYLPASLQPDGG